MLRLNYRFFILAFVIWLIAAPASYGVVGDEDISPARLLEIRNAHETLTEDDRKKDEEEKKAYQIKLIEDKRKQVQSGSEEDKELVAELAKLKSSVLVQKKRWKDRIRISPREKITFDSNIKNQKDAKSDIIYDTGARLELDFSTQRTRIQIDYDGGYARYHHNPKLSRPEHRLATRFRYPVSSKTDIEAAYALSSTGNQNSEIRGILERLKQDASLTFNQRLSRKTGIRLNQTYSSTSFYKKSNEDKSSSQYVISPELNYFLTQKTSTFIRYALGYSNGGENDSNEAVAHEFRGGVRGRIAPKTTAVVDLGYSRQKLKTIGTDVKAFVAEVAIISDITRKSKVELLINRSFSQAVATEGSNFFVTENYRMRGFTQFKRFLSGEATAGVRRNLFEQDGEITGASNRDLILELGAGLRYDFRKWIGIELKYLFSHTASNQSEREYAKHLLSFLISGKY